MSSLSKNVLFSLVEFCSSICSMYYTHTPAALHVIWPGDSKYLHEFVTLALGSLAEGATRHGHLTVHHTHGGVQRAQEHPQVGAALQIHHGMERLREQTEEHKHKEKQLVCTELWRHPCVWRTLTLQTCSLCVRAARNGPTYEQFYRQVMENDVYQTLTQ